MRASLIAVNNSMACGREGVGIDEQEEDPPQCRVLPTRPPRRGPGPADPREGAGSQKERAESDISRDTENPGYEDPWRQKGGAKQGR